GCRCSYRLYHRCAHLAPGIKDSERTLTMKAFRSHKGIVAPIDLANIDTDMIIPKQFLKAINRTGFGPYLFDEMRYQDEGWYGKDCSTRPLKQDFPLNQKRYQGTS